MNRKRIMAETNTQVTSTTNISPAESMQTSKGESKSLDKFIQEVNIADHLSDEKLLSIGQECKAGFEADYQSREEWEDELDEWTKLAMQVRERKSYPWPNASNVKYPLLSTASMQFNARAYPSLIPPDGKLVQGHVPGKDVDGSKGDTAERIATYMSYQFMEEMEDWQEDMDKLLMMLPIVGCMFKKTYWDGSSKKIKSELILPKHLIVNNWAKNLDCAERVSEIIHMSQRVLMERQRQGIFREVELGDPIPDGKEGTIGVSDETTPYHLIEQHTYLDLDDDGYREPYIVTFEREKGTVLRIKARYESKDIQFNPNDSKEVARIDAISYYTKYSFVPNPDGSFYDIGFGVLLGPINEAINTHLNQLTDAGTLSNLQSGFIGKGLRIKMGDNRLMPGEWKPVASTGSDLKSQIVPIPAREPSNVLLQLMQVLITSGKELASVAEIFVGKMPGQNTPATTTMATIEQGMKVFTAVYKRIYRSLDKEFKKVFKLNGIYLEKDTYSSLLDAPLNPEDFQSKDYVIMPAADPAAMSTTEKLIKAQGLMELVQAFGPAMNTVEVLTRILQAQEQPSWQKLVSPQVLQSGQMPPPPPDPKIQALQAKSQMDQQKNQADMANQQFQQGLDQRSQQFDQAMAAQKQQQEQQHAQVMTAIEAHGKAAMDQAKINAELAKTHIAAVQGVQKLAHGEQQHQQKLRQMKEQSSLQKKTSSLGKPAK